MRKSGKEYVQAYNAQAAVDSTAQVIVAQSLSNSATDVQQLDPTVKQIKQNTGRQAQEFSADAGYCSEGNLAVLARHHVDSYIATGRQRHHEASATGRRRTHGTRVAAMRLSWHGPAGAAGTGCASRWLSRCSAKSNRLEGSGSSCCVACRRRKANGA